MKSFTTFKLKYYNNTVKQHNTLIKIKLNKTIKNIVLVLELQQKSKINEVLPMFF